MKEWTFQRMFGNGHRDVVRIKATAQHTAWGRMGEEREQLKEVRLVSVVTFKPKCENPAHDKNTLETKGYVNAGGTVKKEMLLLPYRRWQKLCRVCAKVEAKKYEEHKVGQQKMEANT